MADSQHRVHSSSSLVKQPDRTRANEILTLLINVTRPLLERRQWRVKQLIEFYPRNAGLLGLNMNRGQKVMVRLRSPESPASFLDVESILGTFLHELVHNEISAHSFEFYTLLEKVEGEVQSDMVRMGWFSIHQVPVKSLFSWSESSGRLLGGGGTGPTTSAGRRLNNTPHAQQTTGFYHRSHGFARFGGETRSVSSTARREMLLQAAEKRRADTCSLPPFPSFSSSSSASSFASASSSSSSSSSLRLSTSSITSSRVGSARVESSCSAERFSAEEMDITIAMTQEIDLTEDNSREYCLPCNTRGSPSPPGVLIDLTDENQDNDHPAKKRRANATDQEQRVEREKRSKSMEIIDLS